MIPNVKQQLIGEYSYLFSAVCPETGGSCSLVMPVANTETMDIFLKTLPVQQSEQRIILCIDKAGWHTTKQLVIPNNIVIWFLPPYAPELNPVELIWRELRAKYFNNRTFNSIDDLDNHLVFEIKEYTDNIDQVKALTKSFCYL